MQEFFHPSRSGSLEAHDGAPRCPGGSEGPVKRAVPSWQMFRTELLLHQSQGDVLTNVWR